MLADPGGKLSKPISQNSKNLLNPSVSRLLFDSLCGGIKCLTVFF